MCADSPEGGVGGSEEIRESKSPLEWLREGSLSLANNQEAPLLILLDFYHPGQLLLRILIAALKACSSLSRSDFLLKGK